MSVNNRLLYNQTRKLHSQDYQSLEKNPFKFALVFVLYYSYVAIPILCVLLPLLVYTKHMKHSTCIQMYESIPSGHYIHI